MSAIQWEFAITVPDIFLENLTGFAINPFMSQGEQKLPIKFNNIARKDLEGFFKKFKHKLEYFHLILGEEKV